MAEENEIEDAEVEKIEKQEDKTVIWSIGRAGKFQLFVDGNFFSIEYPEGVTDKDLLIFQAALKDVILDILKKNQEKIEQLEEES